MEENYNNDMFNNFKDALINSKKYLLIYLIFITITGLSTLLVNNFNNPAFQILIFFIVSILGIFSITYYSMHNSDEELWKVAFVIILCFGLVFTFVLPICEVSDECEHFARAEITSNGIIFPHWYGEDMGLSRAYNVSNDPNTKIVNEGAGYNMTGNLNYFYSDYGLTVFEAEHDTEKITNRTFIGYGVFEQNPFYGYLPQALGILIAKLLDLNVIWMLWLGRICNLIFYSGIISYAIKKTPVFKIPLLSVACIPLAIYQASSLSIDCMIFSLGILAVAYFIYMYKSKITEREIAIFTAICILLGLCKITFFALIFLVLFIPEENFTNKNRKVKLQLISVFLAILFALLWSGYSTDALMHSWRSGLYNVNSHAQMEYFLSNPLKIFEFLQQIFTVNLVKLLNGGFNFFSAATSNIHYQDTYYLITLLLDIFLIFTLLIYPKDFKFDLKTRIGTLIIILVMYVGTCVVQLLTWARVGTFDQLGISLRYFLPLLALFPIIGGIDKITFENKEIDYYCIVLIIGFMATLILAFATKYY